MLLRRYTYHQHFRELKLRVAISLLTLLCTSITCYFYSSEIYQILLLPLIARLGHRPEHQIIYTGLSEAFTTYMKLAFFGGLILSIPMLAYQVYAFLSPALYLQERKIIRTLFIISPFLFYIGVTFAYYIIIPLAWSFFLSFEFTNKQASIILLPKMSEYLNLIINLFFAFGLSFQMPIVLIAAVLMGIIDLDNLKRKRKFVTIIIFVIAAFLTPPDVMSQILLAIPLLLLYESSIIACRIFVRSVDVNQQKK